MTYLKIYKYPDKEVKVECKIDYNKNLYKYIKSRGYKSRMGWHVKYYDLSEVDFKKDYKNDLKEILKDTKYKKIEYFKFLKKISNVDKLLENLGIDL